KITDDAVITTKSAQGKTGTWLVDPDGYTIAATGGDITGAALSHLLSLNNITLASTSGSGTGGNIDVNDNVSWLASTLLTLNATHAIYIRKGITATGASAGLALNAGTDIKVDAPVTLSGASAAVSMTYGGDYKVQSKAH